MSQLLGHQSIFMLALATTATFTLHYSASLVSMAPTNGMPLQPWKQTQQPKFITMEVSTANLTEQQEALTTQHLHAESTTKKYLTYVKQAQKWWEYTCTTPTVPLVPSLSESTPEDYDPFKDPDALNALHKWTQASPYAISLFITHKCIIEDCKATTAESIKAAMIKHFDAVYVLSMDAATLLI